MSKLLILNKVVKKDLMRKYNLHRDLEDMRRAVVRASDAVEQF